MVSLCFANSTASFFSRIDLVWCQSSSHTVFMKPLFTSVRGNILCANKRHITLIPSINYLWCLLACLHIPQCFIICLGVRRVPRGKGTAAIKQYRLLTQQHGSSAFVPVFHSSLNLALPAPEGGKAVLMVGANFPRARAALKGFKLTYKQPLRPWTPLQTIRNSKTLFFEVIGGSPCLRYLCHKPLRLILSLC